MLRNIGHRIIKAWQWWVALFMHKEDPRLLAIFRIGIGLSVVVVISSAIFSDVVQMAWIDRAYGGISQLGYGTPLIHLLGGPEPLVVWIVIAVALISGLALTVGFFGKIAAFLALQSTLSLLNLNPYASGGDATLLLSNGLWLLVLSRSSTTWSLDCYLKTHRWSSTQLIPAWPRYLAVLQILLCYFCTGVQKLSIHWLPGGDFSALYYILLQPSWQRFDHQWLAWIFPLTQIGTATVWLWEVFAPLWGIALWLLATTKKAQVYMVANSLRWAFFSLGIVFHLMIYVFMDIGIFSLVSLAFYSCLLIPSDLRFRGLSG